MPTLVVGMFVLMMIEWQIHIRILNNTHVVISP